MPYDPSALSDEEAASSVELDTRSATSSSKKQSRDKKSVKYTIPEPEDFEDEEQNGDGADEGGEDDEEGDEEEEDVYVVEKILDHMLNDDNEPLFLVKWEGYEKKSDQTWEPEDTLIEGASERLKEYFTKIGGREKIFEASAAAQKIKKRGRPSSNSGTPQASSNKRSRKNGDHPLNSEEPQTAKNAAWKPPAGSWEEHIAQLDACEDEDTHKLMVYLTWKNGHKTQHTTDVIYKRCPQKMLQFYERHVRIIKRDPDSEDREGSVSQ
ncbi:hypothetical protein GE21DRAFT_9232 [Neurospora crassa]|uniref:Heterochromatin protein 1 n=4 Tax=Neurospora crassa TaxID=5141 RepID=Q1K612_NEUCR|nr:heterochromatin protein 1 [Neurospora crassa OR74A]AAR19291.1 heterochromatin protein one [Neurospora crassa]EAA28396.1 heterochromatin protein 1 [Neurospora crassa OR74A]KHE86236.1 hypothetical protein GE21DRAFT_9232 [Neurospora crassa]CAD79690.1 conserved hypothetical protein [Neurospora crassa]|eukprot:XP_957632.1 heterochromatin protein 1 [Neurospora crassa OR74A]